MGGRLRLRDMGTCLAFNGATGQIVSFSTATGVSAALASQAWTCSFWLLPFGQQSNTPIVLAGGTSHDVEFVFVTPTVMQASQRNISGFAGMVPP